MNIEQIKKKYLPMTETAFYILISLKKSRHGYGIIKHVEDITKSRIKLGAGTIYGTLSKMEKDSLIISVDEEDRRKVYKLTDNGEKIILLELERLNELLLNGKNELGEK